MVSMNEDPNQSIGFIIHDIARLMRRKFDRRAQAMGLTRAQWLVLAHLKRRDGMRQIELADLLEMQPITLARLIDRLEADEWVTRKNDPEDRRAKRVFLTEKVKPILHDMHKIGQQVREEAMRGLDDAAREQLSVALITMRTNLCERTHI